MEIERATMKKPLMKKLWGAWGWGQLGTGHGWWRHAFVDVLGLDLARGRARARIAAQQHAFFGLRRSKMTRAPKSHSTCAGASAPASSPGICALPVPALEDTAAALSPCLVALHLLLPLSPHTMCTPHPRPPSVSAHPPPRHPCHRTWTDTGSDALFPDDTTGRGEGLCLRSPGGARPPRHATAAAAVFVQLALRWGCNWAAQ